MPNDYASLQSDVSSWAVRDDAVALSAIPGFIRMAEGEIGRRVRVMEQETDLDLNFSDGNNFTVALPSDFLGFKSLAALGSTNTNVVYVAPPILKAMKNQSLNSAALNIDPDNILYTVESYSIKIFAPAGGTGTVILSSVYWKRFASLSDSNTSNSLLQAHYDLYLFASLFYLWTWADEEDQIARYDKLIARSVTQIEDIERKRTRPAGPLVRQAQTSRVV